MFDIINNSPVTDHSKSKKRKRQKKSKDSGSTIQSCEDKKRARQENKIKKLTAELLLMNSSSRAESCLQTLNAIKGNGLASNEGETFGATISNLSSAIKDMPSITLQPSGVNAQLAIPDQQRQPLLLSDIRSMIQAFLPMSLGPQIDDSNWCQVKRKTSQVMVVVVEGVSLATFSDLSLSRAKVNKYYQQLILSGGSQHASAGDDDTLDPSPATNGKDYDTDSPNRSKSKKLKKSPEVYTNNPLASEGSQSEVKSNKQIKNLNNSSSLTQTLLNVKSVKPNSTLAASGHSDLSNTVSAWLPGCCSRYGRTLELVAPGRYGRHVAQDLLLMRLTRKRLRRLKDGLETAPVSLVEQEPEETLYRRLVGDQAHTPNVPPPPTSESEHRAPHEVIHERFAITATVSQVPVDGYQWGRENGKGMAKKNVLKEDNFDRRDLLVSFPDMFTERYPLPEHMYLTYKDLYIPAHKIASSNTESCYRSCVATKPVYAKVRADSPLFGLDCEFVFTSGRMTALGSISVVSEAGELLYHTLVKPKEFIMDYATRWSGLTEKMLRDVTTTLSDVQEHLRRHLPPDAILVGHSLATDLRVMKLYHPYVMDTSLLYNLSGFKANRSKLKTLAKNFLHRDIQMVEKRVGHDPTEDAEATLQLVQLKLQNDHSFGNVITNGSMPSLSDPAQVRLPSQEQYLNMFESLEEHWEQSRQLPTSKPVRDQYSVLCPPSLSSQWTAALHGLAKPAAPRVLEDNGSVIDALCDTAMINDVIIAHLEADPRLLSPKVRPRLAALSALDEQLTRVFDAAATKALCCVIFAGAPPPDTQSSSVTEQDRQQNGMVFFEIKGASSRVRKAAVRRLPTETVVGK